MNYLMKRKTPQQIDHYYEGYMPSQTTTCSTVDGGIHHLASSNLDQRQYAVNAPNYREALIKSNLKADLQNIFILHGSIDIEVPVLAPV